MTRSRGTAPELKEDVRCLVPEYVPPKNPENAQWEAIQGLGPEDHIDLIATLCDRGLERGILMECIRASPLYSALTKKQMRTVGVGNNCSIRLFVYLYVSAVSLGHGLPKLRHPASAKDCAERLGLLKSVLLDGQESQAA